MTSTAASSTSRQGLRRLAALAPDAVLAELGSSPDGLTTPEVARRTARFGPNHLQLDPQEPWWMHLWRRLINPLNGLLLVLAAVSLFTGNGQSAVVIALMVVLSVTLGVVQEHRSMRAASALRAMVHVTATVRRRARGSGAGEAQTVPIDTLVPGDVLHLSAGDLVPADVRVLACKDLFVNEGALTGESLLAEKTALPQPLGDDDDDHWGNVCFMGTHVASGTATAVVVHTGSRAAFGSIAAGLTRVRPATNFDQGIRRFTLMLLRFMAVMVPLVFLVNGVTKGDWLQALLFATAIAVGLTPEMLPMLVTVNLAKGALAMSRKKVIVKRLNAIQDFGAMDVLCTDKTGTLTQDRVVLQRHVDVDGRPSEKVLSFAYLNSYYQSGLKNLLDVAVLQYSDVHARVHAQGLYEKVDEIPFDFGRRRMSVVVQGMGERLLICKGAVEEVFSVCTRAEQGGRLVPLDDSHWRTIERESQALNEEGFRVIAIAYKPIVVSPDGASVHDEADLVLLGYIAFLDPPKDSAAQALEALGRHGVQVKILTGDNAVVTRQVCRQVGLPVSTELLGRDVEAMSDTHLDEVVDSVQVFAKLTPQQKARVIDSLRRRGHVVGYLGDGINDGPALMAADVGVSVDSAVDIAKESADIVLLEKSLTVLDEGVMEGRQVFGNLLKYIRMGASSSFGNVFSVLGASAWLPFLPLAPIQVLTNNLLYDVSQTAIPTDRVDKADLQAPRRWEIGNIARFMLCLGPVSSLFDAALFLTMYHVFGASTPEQAALFRSGWFVESLLSQTLVIHVIRTAGVPWVDSRASVALTLTTLGVCAVGAWLPQSPLAATLGFAPLPGAYWPALALLLAAYLGAVHLAKRWYIRRFGWG